MKPRNILLVEDNDDDAELTIMAFRDAEIENPVVRVRDGIDALDYLFARGPFSSEADGMLPAVVLLDIQLPRVNGIEVLKQLRASEATRHLPVVMLTSSMEDRDRLDAYASHVNSYVRKPIDYDEFVIAARRLGLYWTAINVPAPSWRSA